MATGSPRIELRSTGPTVTGTTFRGAVDNASRPRPTTTSQLLGSVMSLLGIRMPDPEPESLPEPEPPPAPVREPELEFVPPRPALPKLVEVYEPPPTYHADGHTWVHSSPGYVRCLACKALVSVLQQQEAPPCKRRGKKHKWSERQGCATCSRCHLELAGWQMARAAECIPVATKPMDGEEIRRFTIYLT